MSFLWCTTLPSSPLGYFGFDYAIPSPFTCPTPILGGIWDGPCSVPPLLLPFYSVQLQNLCSFIPPVSQVTQNISSPLKYSPACPSKAAWNRRSPLLEVRRSWFLTLHPRYVCSPSALGVFFRFTPLDPPCSINRHSHLLYDDSSSLTDGLEEWEVINSHHMPQQG